VQSGQGRIASHPALLLLAPAFNGWGLFTSMAATNKCLAQNSKSRTGANATKERLNPATARKQWLALCKDTDEILRQSHPDDGDLHRHLLDLHGHTAGECRHARQYAEASAAAAEISTYCLRRPELGNHTVPRQATASATACI